MSRPLPVALLLIAGGGSMDAITYLSYGQVFTNAQSGNVVLLAVHLAERDWAEALKHVPALLGFVPGVLAGQAIAARRTVGPLRSDAAVLAVELAVLLAVGLVGPSLPAGAVTFGISVVSAMQNTGCKTVDGTSYTSVVTTGNLRSASEDLFTGWTRRDGGDLRKARLLGAICAGFALGALAGAGATLVAGKAAIGLPAALVATALLLCLKEG